MEDSGYNTFPVNQSHNGFFFPFWMHPHPEGDVAYNEQAVTKLYITLYLSGPQQARYGTADSIVLGLCMPPERIKQPGSANKDKSNVIMPVQAFFVFLYMSLMVKVNSGCTLRNLTSMIKNKMKAFCILGPTFDSAFINEGDVKKDCVFAGSCLDA